MKRRLPGPHRRHRARWWSLLILLVPCEMIAAIVLIGATEGNPSLGDCTCHSAAGYSIHANITGPVQVDVSGTFDVLIEANGTGGIVQFHPDARDNKHFLVSPGDTIPDNSPLDLNPAAGNVTVIFSIAAPGTEASYTLNFFVRSPTGLKPNIACVEIEVQVGGGNIFLDIIERLLDHYNIYLGAAALVLLVIGTIIYERDKRAVKTHGILCTLALGLTTINVIAIFPSFLAMMPYWSVFSFIDWMHVVHVIVGFLGYGAAILAMIAGLGGIRDKRPGYLALISWIFCFVFGILFWGLGV